MGEGKHLLALYLGSDLSKITVQFQHADTYTGFLWSKVSIIY